MKAIHVSGTKKTAIARGTLTKGTGIIRINSRLIGQYTPVLYRERIREPFTLAGDVAQKVDININVEGGGHSSQAEAARLAIGKALAQHDKKLHQTFLEYDRNLLVADIRRKESKKPNTGGNARAKLTKSYR